jgi:nitrite reductase/ring-hydroxylating ferredoxin subunit
MQDVRQCGVNLNHWWPVAYIEHMPKSGMCSMRLGSLEFVIVRGKDGNFTVFEDACPHKRVRLSRMGKLEGRTLQCQYHGWQFDTDQGTCSSLAGMPGQAHCFNLRSFPCRVYGNWLWVFPGDGTLAELVDLPNIPPVGQADNFYRLPMEGPVHCHFSFMTENSTDLYHSELHRAQQPWANPELLSLEETDGSVMARYEVETPRLIAALFAGSETRKIINVRYDYPYVHIFEEGGGFYLFVTYLPQGPQNTYVFSSFFFPRLLPYRWLSRLLRPLIEPILMRVLNQGTFRKVFQEDIDAVQEEQRAYNLTGRDLGRDVNPVTHAVRRVILQQTQGYPVIASEARLTGTGWCV